MMCSVRLPSADTNRALSDVWRNPVEVVTRTKDGTPVRLTVERDHNSVPQVFACMRSPNDAAERRYLCNGWGVRKIGNTYVEGILTQGRIIEVPKSDWKEVVAEREDLRDKQNLKYVRLVKVYSRGDRVTVDGYTLSTRVDRLTWEKIAPYMYEVDSSVNDELLDGDHFIGWVIKSGTEAEVERLLGITPEKSIHRNSDSTNEESS
jgi:hypothetical protein